MTTSIRRVYRFEAAHRLPNVPAGHKCGRLHGHSYRFAVEVSGVVDPITGWILDFAEIDRAVEPVRAQLDHRYLNEIDGLGNPTSEILAAWIFARVASSGLPVSSVAVMETCASAAIHRGER